MNVSSVGFTPYYYNVNSISRNSLNPISAISSNTSKSNVNFDELVTESAKTINPLKRGESANFADILASQMAMGNLNRSRLLE